MSSNSQHGSPQSNPAPTGDPSPPTGGDVSAASARPVGSVRLMGGLLVAGLCGAVIGLMLIQRFENWYPVEIPPEITEALKVPVEVQEQVARGEITGGAVMGIMMQRVGMENLSGWQTQIFAAERDAALKNSSLAAGLLGLSLAGLCGFLVGLLWRSWQASVVGLILGIVLGGGLGWLGGFAGFLLNEKLAPTLGPEYRTVVMHATIFALIAVAISLTLGGVLRQPSAILRSLAGAIVGAVLAAIVYTVCAALLFPADRADLALPSGLENRLCWGLSGAVLIALAIGYSYRSSAPKQAP